MKNTLTVILCAVSMLLAPGCRKKDNTPDTSARVMFVNGCAGTTPGIDSKVGDNYVSGAQNVAFTTSSGYKGVKSGNDINVSFFTTNTGTPVVNKTLNLSAGGYYTIFCGGLITAPTFVYTTDDMTPPGNTSAKVRFVNLSNDLMSATVTAGTLQIGAGVTGGNITGFATVNAGVNEVKAGDPTNIASVVSTGSVTFAAGKIYTVMLTGSIAGTGLSALKLSVINHN